MFRIIMSKKSSFIVLMISTLFFGFIFLSCQTQKSIQDEKQGEMQVVSEEEDEKSQKPEKTDDKFQSNGLAILNIKEPLILEAFETTAKNMCNGESEKIKFSYSVDKKSMEFCKGCQIQGLFSKVYRNLSSINSGVSSRLFQRIQI